MDIKKTFSKNLHREISMRGIKQVELAEAIHIPPTTLNGWIRGAHLPDIEKLIDIANYLGTHINDLVGYDFLNSNTDDLQKLEKELSNKNQLINDLNAYISELEERAFNQDANVIRDNTLIELRDAGVKEIYLKF